MGDDGLNYVVVSYVITWIVIFGMLARVIGAVRHARAEYQSAVKGGVGQ